MTNAKLYWKAAKEDHLTFIQFAVLDFSEVSWKYQKQNFFWCFEIYLPKTWSDSGAFTKA